MRQAGREGLYTEPLGVFAGARAPYGSQLGGPAGDPAAAKYGGKSLLCSLREKRLPSFLHKATDKQPGKVLCSLKGSRVDLQSILASAGPEGVKHALIAA